MPRGYSLYRVSASGKLNGLSLPTRRDLRFIPGHVSGSVNDDRTLRTNEVDRTGRLGIDVKWGVRADLTLDATVNTDFAQVEADEEQVNLTRFALVFPEKRPFFRERATVSSRPAARRRSVSSHAASAWIRPGSRLTSSAARA